jgi:AbrB family looped-hinge helix DNA binding protein
MKNVENPKTWNRKALLLNARSNYIVVGVPKEVRELYGIKAGDAFELSVNDGCLIYRRINAPLKAVETAPEKPEETRTTSPISSEEKRGDEKNGGAADTV